MVLVDSCGWLEFLSDGELADFFEPYFRTMHQVVVPVVVQYELFKWFLRERGEEVAKTVLATSYKGAIVPLTTEIGLLAAELSVKHRLAMADAMILATARCQQAELITCDAHFDGIPGVRFLSKASGRGGQDMMGS